MATEVEFNVPGHKLRRAERSVGFVVNQNGSKLGTLWVAKGKIEWLPKNMKGTGYKVTWSKFSELMKENGWR